MVRSVGKALVGVILAGVSRWCRAVQNFANSQLFGLPVLVSGCARSLSPVEAGSTEVLRRLRLRSTDVFRRLGLPFDRHPLRALLVATCITEYFQSWPPSGLGCRSLRAGILVPIIAFWLPGGATARGASVSIPSFLRGPVPPPVSSLEAVA